MSTQGGYLSAPAPAQDYASQQYTSTQYTESQGNQYYETTTYNQPPTNPFGSSGAQDQVRIATKH